MPNPSQSRSALGLTIAFIAGSLLIAGIFRATGILPAQEQPILPPDKRSAAPTLEMPLLTSATTNPDTHALWKLSDQRGKVVVVNYFATWCPPCMAEVPDLLTLAKKYQPRGVVFAAISLDQDDDKRETLLHDFIKEHTFTLPILLPPPDNALWRTSFPIPQTYLYDKQGRKARSILGGMGSQDLDQTLDTLLKE